MILLKNFCFLKEISIRYKIYNHNNIFRIICQFSVLNGKSKNNYSCKNQKKMLKYGKSNDSKSKYKIKMEEYNDRIRKIKSNYSIYC